MESQNCSRCREDRPLTDYPPSARGRSGTSCRPCLRAAYLERRPAIPRQCPVCDESFTARTNKVYCSAACRTVGRRLGYQAKLQKMPPVSKAGQEDGGTCARCGAEFTYIRLRKRRTLCEGCHRRRREAERVLGLTVAEATRLRRETESCAICGATNAKWHLDHDHESGAFRGVLCSHCNIGLGHFFDSPTLLRAAADYLGRRSTQKEISA